MCSCRFGPPDHLAGGANFSLCALVEYPVLELARLEDLPASLALGYVEYGLLSPGFEPCIE